jgi:hypothetical protein
MSIRLMLPEGWQALPASSGSVLVKFYNISTLELTIIPGALAEPIHFMFAS